MDSYEASSLIFTKVKSIDPDNAKKIMGYILIQDLAENDLMRLAFGPENLLHSMVIRARIHLGLSSNNTSTPSSPSTLNPIQRPSAAGNPFSSQSSLRVIVPNGFPSPSSPSTHTWPLSGLSNNVAAANSPKSHPLLAESSELVDDGHLSEYLSFLSEDPELFPHHHSNGDSGHFHRRSFSASDASEEFGAGFKPCLYFARGFCKNGSSCKFVHGSCFGAEQAEAEQLQQHDELMRLKAAAAQQQQRLMSLSPSVYNKYMNLILQQQHDPQRAATAMMMGEEVYKFGRCSRSERSEFLSMAEKMNSASRQIYLTFPAESTFKDEDVSEYFNKFGPVQDVRIPYQQKRMFGFVTFVHPETVRFILSKGNPHFICDSRVLVKPYKEKGKVLDKRQQQHQHQLERGEFSSCSSPSESRDAYDFPAGGGGRMFYGAGQEMMLRRKLEQAELQQAIELQGRRLMNLQLPDFHNKTEHHHHKLHHHRSLSLGASILSPHHQHQHHSSFSPAHFDPIIQDLSEGHDEVTITLPPAVSMQQNQHHIDDTGSGNDNVNGKEDLDLHKSMEQSLPENLFASPTKSSGDLSSQSAAEEVVNEGRAATVTPNGPNSQFPVSSGGF